MVLCADYKRMKYSLASDTEQHFDRKLSVNGVQRRKKRTNNILNKQTLNAPLLPINAGGK